MAFHQFNLFELGYCWITSTKASSKTEEVCRSLSSITEELIFVIWLTLVTIKGVLTSDPPTKLNPQDWFGELRRKSTRNSWNFPISNFGRVSRKSLFQLNIKVIYQVNTVLWFAENLKITASPDRDDLAHFMSCFRRGFFFRWIALLANRSELQHLSWKLIWLRLLDLKCRQLPSWTFWCINSIHISYVFDALVCCF